MGARTAVPLSVVVAVVVAACGGGDGDDSSDDAAVATEAPVVTEEPDEPVATDAPAATDAPDATDAPTPTEPPSEETPNTFLGNCADSVGMLDQMTFDAVDCDSPHNAEFAGTVPAPDGAAPSDPDEYEVALWSLCYDTVSSIVPSESADPLAGLGLDIAFETSTSPGEPFDGDIACWLRSPAPESMTGSLLEGTSIETALGDNVMLGAVAIGECFKPALDNLGSIGVGTVEDCSTPQVDQILAFITVPDGPWESQDAIFDFGAANCPSLDSYTDLEPMGDAADVVAMSEPEWVVLGARRIVCTSYRSADFAVPADDGTTGEPSGIGQCFLNDPPGDQDVYDEEVPCSEPHSAELAGFVTPPIDVLPADFDEAAVAMRRACRSVVEELTGRDASLPGTGVGFSVTTGLGEPITDDVACFVEGRGENLLVGSLADVTLDEAYGDVEIMADLDPGTCFLFAGGSTDVGRVVDCGEPDALMVIGSFEMALDEYPGLDTLRSIRNEECLGILDASGLPVDPESISGTIPNVEVWEAFGSRLTTCDGTPL